MERRKSFDTLEFKHIATVNDETEVAIVLGDGTERIIKVPYDTYASQRLGKYKR